MNTIFPLIVQRTVLILMHACAYKFFLYEKNRNWNVLILLTKKLFLKNGWIDRSTLKKIKYIIILVACKLGLGGKSSLSRKIFKYLLFKTFSIGFQSNLINFLRISKTKSSLFTLHHVQINIWKRWKRCFEDGCIF